MSYRSREAKRRKKAAVAAVKREHSDAMRSRYYLTKVKRACRCSGCGCRLAERIDMVFRKDGPVTLCVPCADKDPLVEYRTSVRWERARMARRQKRSPQGDRRAA
jgi:hypothetical protein